MRRIIAAILALIALMGLSAVVSPAARADGDPASDVLVYQSVFNPQDSGASARQYDQLVALVDYVSNHGYPLRVALVNSPQDLGSITQLWKDPHDYGIFLGRELAVALPHDTLLVAMPNGYGLYDPVPSADIPAGDYTWEKSVTPPGSQLIQGTILQVERLAQDNGVTVPANLHVQTSAAVGGSIGTGPLIGLIAGALVIAGAWAASVRIRPLQRRRTVAA